MNEGLPNPRMLLVAVIMVVFLLLPLVHSVAAQSYSVGYSQGYYVPYLIRVDFWPGTRNVSADWLAVDWANAKKTVAEFGPNHFIFKTEDANSFTIRFSAQYDAKNVTVYGVTTEFVTNASLVIVPHESAWSLHGDNFTFVFAVTTLARPMAEHTLNPVTVLTVWVTVSAFEAIIIVYQAAEDVEKNG